MNLDATFWTFIALLKVLHDAALTEGVQALSDCGGFDQVPTAQVTSDKVVKVSNQMLPCCSGGHVWSFVIMLQPLRVTD